MSAVASKLCHRGRETDFSEANRCSISLFICLCICRVSYQCTSWAAVAILTSADPGVDASPTLCAALGPGAPGRPEDWLRTGHPLIAEPVEMAVMADEVRD